MDYNLHKMTFILLQQSKLSLSKTSLSLLLLSKEYININIMRIISISITACLILFLGLFFGAHKSYALTYGLIPPSGELTAGQNADFTISIDTEGQNLTTATVGMTYQTGFMQYVQTTKGNTLDTVTAQETTPGTIIFTGTKSSGFTGAGDFAKVTFKITATSQTNEVCALFIPQASPSPAPVQPTTPPGQPTSPPAPTQRPGPTALPQTGSPQNNSILSIIGLGVVSVLGGTYLFRKKLQ